MKSLFVCSLLGCCPVCTKGRSVCRFVHPMSLDVFGYHCLYSSSESCRPRFTSVTLKTVPLQFERPVGQDSCWKISFLKSPSSLLKILDIVIDAALCGICYVRLNVKSSTCVSEDPTRLLIQGLSFNEKPCTTFLSLRCSNCEYAISVHVVHGPGFLASAFWRVLYDIERIHPQATKSQPPCNIYCILKGFRQP